MRHNKRRLNRLMLVMGVLVVSVVLSGCDDAILIRRNSSVPIEVEIWESVRVAFEYDHSPNPTEDSINTRTGSLEYEIEVSGPGEYETFCAFAPDLSSRWFFGCYILVDEPGIYSVTVRVIVPGASRLTNNFHTTQPLTFEFLAGGWDELDPGGGSADPQDTTLRVTTRPNPSGVGEVVVVAVELLEGSGGELPSGEVEITIPDDGFSCTITLVGDADTNSSKGGCNWTPSGVGTYAVGASYAGGAQFNGSTDSASHTVEAAPSPTSTTSIDRVISPNLSVQGQSATFYVSVSGSGDLTPTGNVSVSGAGGSCTATLDANGEGTCSYAMKTLGQHTITASYGGDSLYEGSSTAMSYGVIAPPTATPKPESSGCSDPNDSDCDGLPNSDDRCPNQGGKVDNFGCPIP